MIRILLFFDNHFALRPPLILHRIDLPIGFQNDSVVGLTHPVASQKESSKKEGNLSRKLQVILLRVLKLIAGERTRTSTGYPTRT